MTDRLLTETPSDQQIYCLTGRCPKYEFSDQQIDAMRSHLAKAWRQSVSQVTEYEAVHYLRLERPS